MSTFYKYLIVFILLFATLTKTHAQFSWKPKPYPRSRSFLVTDFQTLVRVNAPPHQRWQFFHFDTLEHVWTESLRGKLSLISDLGVMLNLNPHYAMGLSHILVANFGGDQDGLYGGLKVRFRRWLNQKNAIEFSPGLLMWGNTIGGTFKSPGLAASIDYRWQEILGVSVYVEYLLGQDWQDSAGQFGSSARTDNDLGVYVGARSGAIPGLIANAAGFAALGAIAVIFAIGSGDD
ncbi:MAG: hypothetical protein D6715_13715 [Calditrichaeota bacterium]|nr:MAG: hypothetical protein D6715_13715 [Calditrichota bacterium]